MIIDTRDIVRDRSLLMVVMNYQRVDGKPITMALNRLCMDGSMCVHRPGPQSAQCISPHDKHINNQYIHVYI